MYRAKELLAVIGMPQFVEVVKDMPEQFWDFDQDTQDLIMLKLVSLAARGENIGKGILEELCTSMDGNR